MRRMTERTIREILPSKIVKHYEKHDRFTQIEWVSINEASTLAKIRMDNGVIECWKFDTAWNRYPLKDAYVR